MAIINRGYTYIGFEPTYGAGQLAYASLEKRNWNVEFTRDTQQITTTKRRVGLADEIDDIVAGNTMGTAVVTGEFTYNDEILLQAALLSNYLDGTAGKEFLIRSVMGWNGTTNDADYSLAIYKSLPDLAATACDYALGCVLQSLQITGATADTLKFTATFRCKLPLEGDAVTFTGTPGDVGLASSCINFGSNVELSQQSRTKMSGFTLNIENTFADDAAVFQNSTVKTDDIVINTKVTLEVVGRRQLQAVEDVSVIMDADALQSSITVTDVDSNEMLFEFSGKYLTNPDTADANNVIMRTYTLQCMDDGSNSPFEVTYS